MREAIFNTEVKNSLELAGAFAHKIADLPQSMLRGSRFNPEKPCDILGGYRGAFIGIEGKQIKDFKSFGISALRDNQIEALNDMLAKGNEAFVFLNVRMGRETKRGKKLVKTDPCNILLIFRWKKWRTIWSQRSLKKDEVMTLALTRGLRARPILTGKMLSKNGKKVPEKKTLFDLRPFLKTLLAVSREAA